MYGALIGAIPLGPVAQQVPLLRRLEPLSWLRAVTGLIAIVTLGLVLILVVLTGARITRNYVRRQTRPPEWDEDDWARAPVSPADLPERGNVESGDEQDEERS
jgi:hypothetical protein